jgi:uncharacterized membrane-anchored protein YhcB (DUF1043 family)
VFRALKRRLIDDLRRKSALGQKLTVAALDLDAYQRRLSSHFLEYVELAARLIEGDGNGDYLDYPDWLYRWYFG